MSSTTLPSSLRVAVIGAGAVGCYYGGMLARAGHAVTLVGRPQHVEAVRAHGLRMQTRQFDEQVQVQASTTPDAAAGADLVLFSVKSPDTEATGRELLEHLAPHALVLTLQNGVDNAERLRGVLPHEVVAAVVYVATEMAGPGHVRHHGRGDLVIEPGPRSAALAQALGAAGVPTQVSADARSALWAKLVHNCAYNAISAITQLPYGRMVQGVGVEQVMADLVAECLAVAAADGVVLPTYIQQSVSALARAMPTQSSSTAQDLARGKPSEIDHLNGLVVRRGEALGVPTPVNRAMWALVKLLETAARD
ncbi:MAG: ketopantoate reductase family protein [Pseudorhodoferax sp.]